MFDQKHTVTTPLTITSYWEAGPVTGSPVFFVHGFRGDHHGLLQIAERFHRIHPEVRCIIPDLPGFGQSQAIPGREHTIDSYGEWLTDFTAAISDRPNAVVAHSFGTLVTAAAVSQNYRPVSAVLINPIAANALKGPRAILTRVAVGYYALARKLPTRAADALIGHPLIVRSMSEIMAKTKDPGLRRWIHQQHDQFFSKYSDKTTLLEAFTASVSNDVTAAAAAFTMPTRVIAGTLDDITSLVDQLELVQRMPDANLQVLQGTGHLVHYEAADDAAELIAEHLTASSVTQ